MADEDDTAPAEAPPARPGDDVARKPQADAELPENVTDAIEEAVEQLIMERYSSQFPHPEHLERYAKLYPDAPRLVFDNFDKQSEHRRQMEKVFVDGAMARILPGCHRTWHRSGGDPER